MTKLDDVVLLAPGFLGFDHFGGFPYFSQGVAAALRVALDAEVERLGRRTTFEVQPLTTVPVGSLAQRQKSLAEQIGRLLHHLKAPDPLPRIHLVGHSTGGVDIELLVRTRPVGRERQWTESEEKIRRAVRSVIAIAPPAAGTGIANSALVRDLATKAAPDLLDPRKWSGGLRDLAKGFEEGARLVRAVFALGWANAELSQLVAGGIDDLHPLLRFIHSVFFDRKLLDNLRPENTQKIVSDTGPVQPRTLIRRYLTIARVEPGNQPTGRLFADLHKLTAEGLRGNQHARAVAAMLKARADAQIPVIRSMDKQQDPDFSEEANDGVVNTALQIPFGDDATLEAGLGQIGAIVVADHLDVVGGFPMKALTTEHDAAANGFLNSGSQFRGRQFSELYRKIARDIAGAMT